MAETAKREPGETPKKDTPAGGQALPSWGQRFLDAFRDTGIVQEAAKKAGVGKATVYRHKASNPTFAAAWDEVEEWTTQQLEQVAVKRAVDGSDLLLIFLLKARRPHIYRETMKVEHGGKISHEIEQGIHAAIEAHVAENERLRDRLAELEPAEPDPRAR